MVSRVLSNFNIEINMRLSKFNQCAVITNYREKQRFNMMGYLQIQQSKYHCPENSYIRESNKRKRAHWNLCDHSFINSLSGVCFPQPFSFVYKHILWTYLKIDQAKVFKKIW